MALGDLVQSNGLIDASGDSTISYPSVPTVGNLLVTVVGNRSGLTSTTMLSAGWNQRAELSFQPGDTNLRILGAVYTKTAGASEPQLVTVESSPFFLHIAELDSAGETLTFLEEAILGTDAAGSFFSVLSTGTTASVPSGDHLNVGVGVVKHGPAMDPWVTWAGDVDTFRSSFDGGGTNQMSISTGIGIDSTGGTKEATLTGIPGDDDTDRSAIGAILVFAVGAGSPVDQDVSPATETDSATATRQTAAHVQPVAAGGETGTAVTLVQAVARAQQVTSATETGTAAATSPATAQAQTVASGVETATASPTAQAVVRAQPVAAASEFDTASPAVNTTNLAQPVPLAGETDIAAPTVQDVSDDQAVAAAIETDSAEATLQIVAVAQLLAPATETDIAQPLIQTVPRIQLVAAAAEINVGVAVLQLASDAPIDQPAGPVRTVAGQRRLTTIGSRSLTATGNRRLTTENT